MAGASVQAMGLTLINNTNLEYFPTEQQAAMFRLQGMLFEAMEDNTSQAAQLFFTALHIHDADAQSWLVWGKLCAAKSEKHAQDIAKARSMEQSQKDLVRLPPAAPRLMPASGRHSPLPPLHLSVAAVTGTPRLLCFTRGWRVTA